MPTSPRTGSRSATSARSEIIEMLKEDHRRAKKSFRAFEKLDPEQNAEECQQIVQQTCAELTLHTTLEEECFYPAARSALQQADLIDEAEVEHQSAKDLIAKLGQMSPGDDKYGATFIVLGEYIAHHVKEEEIELFPALSRVELDWDGLCDEMNSRRAELMEQLMPETEESSEAEATPARAAAGKRGAGGRGAAARTGSSTSRPQAATGQSDDED